MPSRHNWHPHRMSQRQYWTAYEAFGNQMFQGAKPVYREDTETILANWPPADTEASKEMAGFVKFMWQNAARFIDIAGETTRRLRGVRRDDALETIVATAWASVAAFNPTEQSPTQWFRAICRM